MRRSGIFWGAILLVVGSLLLLSNLGIVTVDIWSVLLPLGLILFGVWVLVGVFSGREAIETQQLSIPLDDSSDVNMQIHFGAGRLHIADNAAPGVLLEGSFTGGVDTARNERNGRTSLELRPHWNPNSMWGAPWNWSDRGYEWTMAISREKPVALRVQIGAADSSINLEQTQLKELWLSTGASSTTVVLPERAGYSRVKVEAGAASITLRIPSGVAARVHTQSGISSIEVNTARFPRVGDVYLSGDYETADNKLDIDVQVGVGSVAIQ